MTMKMFGRAHVRPSLVVYSGRRQAQTTRPQRKKRKEGQKKSNFKYMMVHCNQSRNDSQLSQNRCVFRCQRQSAEELIVLEDSSWASSRLSVPGSNAGITEARLLVLVVPAKQLAFPFLPFLRYRLGVPWLVSWCFEPSQPQRITSGLYAVVSQLVL